jgi:hypothetical protein
VRILEQTSSTSNDVEVARLERRWDKRRIHYHDRNTYPLTDLANMPYDGSDTSAVIDKLLRTSRITTRTHPEPRHNTFPNIAKSFKFLSARESQANADAAVQHVYI